MKILFSIQATGNGHVSRAREIIPHLLNYGEVDLLLSGRQADVGLPYLVKYKKKGIGYTFGKNGGVDVIDSIKHFRPFHFMKDVYSFPVENYDVIINDFEPVIAWACKLKKKKCVALSHQSSYLSPKTPRPNEKDIFAEWVLKNYAPTTSHYGFHFQSFDENIYTPVIRSEVRNLEIKNHNHITVYLPAHADEILLQHFLKVKDVRWEVFSKHTKLKYTKENVIVKPVLNEDFLQSLATSDGLLTAGGFESPAEAIHLRKKILAVPMDNQYEQKCNAEAMKSLGIIVVKKIDNEFTGKLKNWLNYGFPINIYYPDITGKIIEELMVNYSTLNVHLFI